MQGVKGFGMLVLDFVGAAVIYLVALWLVSRHAVRELRAAAAHLARRPPPEQPAAQP